MVKPENDSEQSYQIYLKDDKNIFRVTQAPACTQADPWNAEKAST